MVIFGVNKKINVMKKKFTKGEWHYDNIGVYTYNTIDGNVVCQSPEYEKSYENWEANAKLIAAAPDLLDALQNLVNCILPNQQTDEMDTLNNRIIQAQDVIKKAL